MLFRSGDKLPSWMWVLVAACGVGLATSAWIVAVRVPQLGREAAAIRAERAALDARSHAGSTTSAPPAAGGTDAMETTLASVRLQPDGSTPGVVTVSTGTRRIVVWLDGADASSTAGLDVQTSDGRMIMQAGNIRSNGQGGFVVSMPAAKMPPGTYRLRIFSVAQNAPPKTASYLLSVRAN